MAERMVKTHGIELWTESFGDSRHPALLLIMGASAQGLGWPEALIEQLVAGGRYVLRYDHRDTGQSSSIDFQQHPYTLADLAEDAMGVLDAYSLASAHLVGASMGGMVGQLAALQHPDRVRTLTCLMSTPLRNSSVEELVHALQGAPLAGALPPPAPHLLEVFMQAALNPPMSREAVIDFQLRLARALAGSAAPFDEEAHRRLQARMYDRARNPASSANHSFVPSATREQAEALRHLRPPTLVIHGEEDPMFPLAHGQATAKAIPGARILTFEKMGHDFPAPLLAPLAQAILAHTQTRS